MTQKLSDLAALLPDKPKNTRPKSPEQIMELIGMLDYEAQVTLYDWFKNALATITQGRINDAELTASKLRDFHNGLNGQG